MPFSCMLSTRLPKFNVLWGFVKYVLCSVVTYKQQFLQDVEGCQDEQGLGHMAYVKKVKVGLFSLEKKGAEGES